jgi:hypothetical protein
MISLHTHTLIPHTHTHTHIPHTHTHIYLSKDAPFQKKGPVYTKFAFNLQQKQYRLPATVVMTSSHDQTIPAESDVTVIAGTYFLNIHSTSIVCLSVVITVHKTYKTSAVIKNFGNNWTVNITRY